MRNGVLILLISCIFGLNAWAQKQQFRVEERREGIVVLKLTLCNPIDDEYCLVSQNIYFKKNWHTLSSETLFKALEKAGPNAAPANAKVIMAAYKTHQGFHNITATSFFSKELLASGDGWRRHKSGALYIPRSANPFSWNTVYIAYKVKGTFAFSGPEVAKYYEPIYANHYQPTKEPINYPVAEVLSIEYFRPLSAKETKKLGMKYCTMPYYRLKTSGLEAFLDQTEAGRRDQAR